MRGARGFALPGADLAWHRSSSRFHLDRALLVENGVTPAQIEALDMSRHALHNEGSELLKARLDGKVEVDFLTARRLFTLICALHWRG